MTEYSLTDRGLRKTAARNGCTLVKETTGWTVLDAVTASLVADQLTATQVRTLFV